MKYGLLRGDRISCNIPFIQIRIINQSKTHPSVPKNDDSDHYIKEGT